MVCTINKLNYILAIFIQLLLHSADEKNTILSVETSQVQNMKNINEMNQFVSSIMGVNIPEFGKKNSISKLGSISKTQNLIDDFESLKHEHEMLNQNLSILKMQNELLVKENKNLQEIKGNSDEVKVLREKLIVSTNKFKRYNLFFKMNKNLTTDRLFQWRKTTNQINKQPQLWKNSNLI
jgi:hypothetical protein